MQWTNIFGRCTSSPPPPPPSSDWHSGFSGAQLVKGGKENQHNITLQYLEQTKLYNRYYMYNSTKECTLQFFNI